MSSDMIAVAFLSNLLMVTMRRGGFSFIEDLTRTGLSKNVAKRIFVWVFIHTHRVYAELWDMKKRNTAHTRNMRGVQEIYGHF